MSDLQAREPKISATEPDWSREKLRKWWMPSRQLLKSIRKYQKWQKKAGIIGKLFSSIAVLEHRFWSVITGAEIPINCQIEGGLMLTHPNGVVISPKASIGPNCLILQQVTITRNVKILGHVDIGAGAKILNGVTIGNHAKIGANAVVLCDVPDGATAVGVPARIVVKEMKLEDGSMDEEDVHHL
ncbi:serine O-acetyltransferase [Gloeocapsa sp. PCC 73106]|uniref:serine O-acetyltransferase n=1 Tax=Gloeocapsa sp. PCC 73106 TaxID=102232 RepID=UPI0002ABABCE|nr:serine acetyltransferase [Gloeocapsa sp. PCC 73106]ELR99275.1 serine acetyltransferase [Gloeocapsa sp. PCC 73106]